MVDLGLLLNAPELENELEFERWSDSLESRLKTENLDKYLERPVPDNGNYVIYEKTVVTLTIWCAISKEIRDHLIFRGYDTQNEDPYVLFEALKNHVSRVSGMALLKELMTIERKNFASVYEFVAHAQDLKDRVQEVITDLGDTAILYAVVDGLEEYDIHAELRRRLLDGELTWDMLLTQVYHKT